MKRTLLRALLLATIMVAACSRLEAKPYGFSGFGPASGGVCSEVTITGNIPVHFTGLHVTFNGLEAADARVASVKKNPFSAAQRVIIAIVPGEASSGPIGISLVPMFYPLPGSAATVRQTFSQPFTVTGKKIKQPVISSFTATPDLIDTGTGGSTLRWSIDGPRTVVELDGKTVAGGPFLPQMSSHVDPLNTTTYRLSAGNHCVSVSKVTTVKVLPRLTLSASPTSLFLMPGTSASIVVTIDKKLSPVVITCNPVDMCPAPSPMPIPISSTQGSVTVQQVEFVPQVLTITGTTTAGSQTANAQISVNTNFRGGNFQGPLQFERLQYTTDPSTPQSGNGPCVGWVASTSADMMQSWAQMSCGNPISPQIPFSVVPGGSLGGLASCGDVKSATCNQLFVVADPIDMMAVRYSTFELPTQILGGLTPIPPPSAVPSTPPGKPTAPPWFPIYGNIGSGNPSFWFSPDGSIGLIMWSRDPTKDDACRNGYAFYDLFDQVMLAEGTYNGSQPVATVSPAPNITMASAITFTGDPVKAPVTFRPCGVNNVSPMSVPAITIK